MEIGQDIAKAAAYVREGKLVGIPTETVYGLAGNGFDALAVASIFAAKRRPSFDPLILHTDSLVKLRAFVGEVSPLAERLARTFWPGPLTLILPKKDLVPDLVTSGLDTVGVRIPKHPLALELLALLDFPLAAPSANMFGYISPTRAEHLNGLGESVSYVLDGGACTLGVESTIVRPETDRLVVLRKGGIPLESLEEFAVPIEVQTHSSSQPQAPGMLHQHYAPRTPILVGDLPALLATQAAKRVGVISFQKNYPQAAENVVLSPKGDVTEAAKHLFAALRQLDASKLDVILAEWVPEEGLGRAINDRLRRAAYTAE